MNYHTVNSINKKSNFNNCDKENIGNLDIYF